MRGGDYRGCRSAFPFHLAGSDEFVSEARVQRLGRKLELERCPLELQEYPGTRHWFCDQEQDEAFDVAAAELAFARTKASVHRHLLHGTTTAIA
ncbi:MAG TPA: dienelactone hydrolase family protein [Acidimicrobiia bacterium]|nr:dienelactone hydrolase family protein [Acidimicrobiia bacterium]